MDNMKEKIKKDTEEAIIRKKESEKYLDRIRGSLIGGEGEKMQAQLRCPQ